MIKFSKYVATTNFVVNHDPYLWDTLEYIDEMDEYVLCKAKIHIECVLSHS